MAVSFKSHGQLASVAAATPIPAVEVSGARRIEVVASGGDVRWKIGEDPTAAVGMLLEEKKIHVFEMGIADLRFIDAGGTAVVDYTIYG